MLPSHVPLSVVRGQQPHPVDELPAQTAEALTNFYMRRTWDGIMSNGEINPCALVIYQDHWVSLMFNRLHFLKDDAVKDQMFSLLRAFAWHPDTWGIAFGCSVALTTWDGIPSAQQVENAPHDEEGLLVIGEWRDHKPTGRIRRIHKDASGTIESFTDSIDDEGKPLNIEQYMGMTYDLMGQFEKAEGRF